MLLIKRQTYLLFFFAKVQVTFVVWRQANFVTFLWRSFGKNAQSNCL